MPYATDAMNDLWGFSSSNPGPHEFVGVIVLGVGLGWGFWRYVPQVRVWLGLGVGSVFFGFLVFHRLVMFPSVVLTALRVWIWVLFLIFCLAIIATMNGLRLWSRWRSGRRVDEVDR